MKASLGDNLGSFSVLPLFNSYFQYNYGLLVITASLGDCREAVEIVDIFVSYFEPENTVFCRTSRVIT